MRILVLVLCLLASPALAKTKVAKLEPSWMPIALAQASTTQAQAQVTNPSSTAPVTVTMPEQPTNVLGWVFATIAGLFTMSHGAGTIKSFFTGSKKMDTNSPEFEQTLERVLLKVLQSNAPDQLISSAVSKVAPGAGQIVQQLLPRIEQLIEDRINAKLGMAPSIAPVAPATNGVTSVNMSDLSQIGTEFLNVVRNLQMEFAGLKQSLQQNRPGSS